MENKINIACFKEGSRTAEIKGIWQWDYGQILRIQDLNLPSAVEIHFSLDEHGGEAARRIGVAKDGVTDVPIPDSMVENESAYGDSYYFFAYIYLTDETSGNTEYKIRAKVTTRSKPEGYNSGDSTFAAILKTVNEISDGKADGLKYENSILKLLSGEKEIARVTITSGSGGGADAREIELQKGETALQWRYVGVTEWTDLISLAEITGPAGTDGQDGKDGKDGIDGAPGKDGKDGQNGADGITPHIGENGNWYIGSTDTGKPSRGETGAAGSDGQDGDPGADGKDGANGKDGADGKSAYQYAKEGGYTGTETEFAEKLAKDIPSTLPNPHSLKFTGAVTGSYDGSEEVSVNIPSGVGGGVENAKYYNEIILEEDVSTVEVSVSEFSHCNVIFIQIYIGTITINDDTSVNRIVRYKFDTKGGAWSSGCVINSHELKNGVSEEYIGSSLIVINDSKIYYCMSSNRRKYDGASFLGINSATFGQYATITDNTALVFEIYNRTHNIPSGTVIRIIGF